MQKLCSSSFLAFIGPALVLLSGCGVKNPPLQVGSSLAGNWSFAPANSTMALNLGFTQGSYETVSAVARLSGASCLSPTTDIILSGSVTPTNEVTLVSAPVNGSVLTLKGQVAEDGDGMAGATWSFTGGNCGSLGRANVAATDYAEIAGNYQGTFTDTAGDRIPVKAFLQQTTLPNGDGQFNLTGTATFPSNTCFVQQPTVTESVVTGPNLSMTYVDPGSGAVLTAAGTFNSTATQLTITNWSIQGGACDGDTGAGLMTSASAVE